MSPLDLATLGLRALYLYYLTEDDDLIERAEAALLEVEA